MLSAGCERQGGAGQGGWQKQTGHARYGCWHRSGTAAGRGCNRPWGLQTQVSLSHNLRAGLGRVDGGWAGRGAAGAKQWGPVQGKEVTGGQGLAPRVGFPPGGLWSASIHRNLSSASQATRQKMRECHGLVDALVTYINHALDVGKCEDKVRGGHCQKVLGGSGPL